MEACWQCWFTLFKSDGFSWRTYRWRSHKESYYILRKE